MFTQSLLKNDNCNRVRIALARLCSKLKKYLRSNHRRSQDKQLGGLKFKKSYPTVGTDPENFGGKDADFN